MNLDKNSFDYYLENPEDCMGFHWWLNNRYEYMLQCENKEEIL